MDNLESFTGMYSYKKNPMKKPKMTDYKVGTGCPDSQKINMLRKEQYAKKDSKRIGNYEN